MGLLETQITLNSNFVRKYLDYFLSFVYLEVNLLTFYNFCIAHYIVSIPILEVYTIYQRSVEPINHVFWTVVNITLLLLLVSSNWAAGKHQIRLPHNVKDRSDSYRDVNRC